VVDDQIWVPVEITMIGKQGFLEAWRKGADLWNSYDADPGQRVFNKTSDAQAVYRPVALKESDLGLQYGSKDELLSAYRSDFNRLSDTSLKGFADAAEKSGDKRDWNTLGIAYARYGRLKEAETAFQRAIRIDKDFANAQVNMGNISYVQKNYDKALKSFQIAEALLSEQGQASSLTSQKVLINLSKTFNALARFDEARSVYEKASSIDPARVRDFAYLAEVGAGSGSVSRASEQKDDILFVDN